MSGMGGSECLSLGEVGKVEVVGGAVRLFGTTTLAGRSVFSLSYLYFNPSPLSSPLLSPVV